MSLTIAAFLSLMYYDRDFLADLRVLYEENQTTFENRKEVEARRAEALDAIAALQGLDDPRLTTYYRYALWNKEYGTVNVLGELLIDRFYSHDRLTLLIDSMTRDSGLIRALLPDLYRIRSRWWSEKNFQIDINKLIATKFSTVAGKSSKVLEGSGKLSWWGDMCRCYAYNGNFVILPACEEALTDKRRLVVITGGLPNPPAQPMTTRVCDDALMALLILHQADVERIFAEYGMRNIREQDRFQEQNDAVFDKVIADYGIIKKKYFVK